MSARDLSRGACQALVGSRARLQGAAAVFWRQAPAGGGGLHRCCRPVARERNSAPAFFFCDDSARLLRPALLSSIS